MFWIALGLGGDGGGASPPAPAHHPWGRAVGYLVQAFLDGQWLPVGDQADDLRQAVAVRARLASGGIWSKTRIAVVNEWGLVYEIIEDWLADASPGSEDDETKDP